MTISSQRLLVHALLSFHFTEWHQGKVKAGTSPDQTTKTIAKMRREVFRILFPLFLLWPAQMCGGFGTAPFLLWLSCSLVLFIWSKAPVWVKVRVKLSQFGQMTQFNSSCRTWLLSLIYSPCFKYASELPWLTSWACGDGVTLFTLS